MRISWSDAKRKLAIVWFTGGGILFFLILLRSICNEHIDQTVLGRDWNWFLPAVVPTLSLITGVLVMDSREGADETRTVDRFLFRLTFILSLIYLITIMMFTILNQGRIDLEQANLWLAPFQGLITSTLGAFFIQKKKE